ncbi:LDLR chaperone boca [Parasteatoda tepidariorum]|uniref:LDLR chaperone boca n=1 Tax=Parasteatoda tepidariorum TaxID=114398 RepID=UPI00077FD40B|nr:LDLR chaperone boca [Parasteatoda tepidariorum]
MFSNFFIFIVLFLLVLGFSNCKKSAPNNKPDWAKKDVRDFSDADLERLLDQWDEDEEPLESDELPEHLRPPPKIDISQFSDSNPEAILKASKKGKSLMVFVTVSGNPTEKETEDITTLWQTSLMNNHINIDRYPIGSDRVIFMFKDGSQAWEAKDFLVEQKRMEVVVIESKEYYGKYSSKKDKKSKKKEEL